MIAFWSIRGNLRPHGIARSHWRCLYRALALIYRSNSYPRQLEKWALCNCYHRSFHCYNNRRHPRSTGQSLKALSFDRRSPGAWIELGILTMTSFVLNKTGTTFLLFAWFFLSTSVFDPAPSSYVTSSFFQTSTSALLKSHKYCPSATHACKALLSNRCELRRCQKSAGFWNLSWWSCLSQWFKCLSKVLPLALIPKSSWFIRPFGLKLSVFEVTYFIF